MNYAMEHHRVSTIVFATTLFLTAFFTPSSPAAAPSSTRGVTALYCDQPNSRAAAPLFLGTGTLLRIDNRPMLLSHRYYLAICHKEQQGSGLSVMVRGQLHAVTGYFVNNYWRIFIGELQDADQIAHDDVLEMTNSAVAAGAKVVMAGLNANSTSLTLPPAELSHDPSFYPRIGFNAQADEKYGKPYAYITSLPKHEIPSLLGGPVFTEQQQFLGFQVLQFPGGQGDRWYSLIMPSYHLANWTAEKLRAGQGLGFVSFDDFTQEFDELNPEEIPEPSKETTAFGRFKYAITLLDNADRQGSVDLKKQANAALLQVIKNNGGRPDWPERIDTFLTFELGFTKLAQSYQELDDTDGWLALLQIALDREMYDVVASITHNAVAISRAQFAKAQIEAKKAR
jgi:hypothetical protein